MGGERKVQSAYKPLDGARELPAVTWVLFGRCQKVNSASLKTRWGGTSLGACWCVVLGGEMQSPRRLVELKKEENMLCSDVLRELNAERGYPVVRIR